MRIITLNMNGIRSAANKGFFQWMLQQHAEIVCVQETKAQEYQLTDEVLRPKGYYTYFFDAKKKGYSGVAIYTRHQPDNVQAGLGWLSSDDEGRYLQVDFGKLSIASIYLPSGTSGEERQNIKFKFLEDYGKKLMEMRKDGREYILCGDWNIAHKPIDLKNWKANQKNTGFLPEERAWLDFIFDELGYVDAFRVLNQEPDQYTWWSQRGQARAKNVGWRIDYQIVTPNLKSEIEQVGIYKEEYFSDHAPLIVDYKCNLKDFK